MMMPYRLPPAGNHSVWSAGVDESAMRGLFAPWDAVFFDSGTGALAALLTTLRTRRPQRKEVILAAYNCPNLISAVQFSGCEARLADLTAGRPWMDLEGVSRLLTSRTLAIIGVDLCGIPERYGPLREMAAANGCTLIQDSAQGFPNRAGDTAWHGDAVILSFGRGKPVSLLAGGATLCRERALARELSDAVAKLGQGAEGSHRRRVKAYNVLRRPYLYWLPASLPFLHLGETHYRPLAKIAVMPPWLKRRIPPAVAAYRARGCGAEAKYPLIALDKEMVDVARACGVHRDVPLSRYPMLAPNPKSRDRIWKALQAHGVSRLYGAILPELEGLKELLIRQGDFANASDFAKRLFTLPTHDGVRHRDEAAIRRVLDFARVSAAKPLGDAIG